MSVVWRQLCFLGKGGSTRASPKRSTTHRLVSASTLGSASAAPPRGRWSGAGAATGSRRAVIGPTVDDSSAAPHHCRWSSSTSACAAATTSSNSSRRAGVCTVVQDSSLHHRLMLQPHLCHRPHQRRQEVLQQRRVPQPHWPLHHARVHPQKAVHPRAGGRRLSPEKQLVDSDVPETLWEAFAAYLRRQGEGGGGAIKGRAKVHEGAPGGDQ